ncbi:MAG: Ig-like domain-containing protein [Muribaculaceae bacterium]|nr:Ig-like domain-containing protein [Muribaculaceae bacterium]
MKLNHIAFLSASLLASSVVLTSCDDDKVYDLNHEEAMLISEISFAYDNELTLPVGMEMPLNVTITPEESADQKVVYKTSDSKVAYVDDNGILHTVGIGECNISCVPEIGFGATAKMLLKVVESVNYAQSLTLRSVETMPDYLYEGDELALTADYTPVDHTYNYLEWSTSDPAVATVDENGVVTCVKPGTATISASTTFPDKEGIKGSISIKINEAVDVESVTIAPVTEAICVTCPFDLDVTYTPVYGTKGSVEWTSSDETVAVVTRGRVTPIGFGTCTLTATCANGSEASVEITVTSGWYIWSPTTTWGLWGPGSNASITKEDNGMLVKMTEMKAGGDWRGDIKYTCDENSPLVFNFIDYPVLAFRGTFPINGRNTLDAISTDGVNSGGPQCNVGRYGQGDPILLSDGSYLIYYDMKARGKYQDKKETGFRLFQIKVADIPAADAGADKSYKIYWCRTFKSVDDMKAYAEAELAK